MRINVLNTIAALLLGYLYSVKSHWQKPVVYRHILVQRILTF